MRMKTLLGFVIGMTLVVGFDLSDLEAGTIGVGPPLSDDVSTRISPSKTYTHAIGGGAGAFVNGVKFEPLTDDDSPMNLDWNPNGFPRSHIACCNKGDWDPASGGVTGPELITLLGSFTFSSDGDGNPASQTFTLSELAPGTTYDARLYIRMWDSEGSGRPIDLTFTNGNEVDSTGPSLEDRPSAVGLPNDHSAYYVNYRYTAQAADLVIDAFVVDPSPSGSFHLYALTNEVVPEPGSLALVAIGMLAVLPWCRR